MKHFNSPAVYSYVLAGHYEYKGSEDGHHFPYLFAHQHLFKVDREVHEDGAHNDLSRNDPRLPLAYRRDMIELHNWRPDHFEAERHSTEHDHSYL